MGKHFSFHHFVQSALRSSQYPMQLVYGGMRSEFSGPLISISWKFTNAWNHTSYYPHHTPQQLFIALCLIKNNENVILQGLIMTVFVTVQSYLQYLLYKRNWEICTVSCKFHLCSTHLSQTTALSLI